MTDVKLIDLASAKKAIEAIAMQVNKDKVRTVARCANAIDLLPAIDAVPVVHARWIRVNDEQAYFDVEYDCSVCQFPVAVTGIGTPILHGYHYCPRCGAKMDGGAKNNDA